MKISENMNNTVNVNESQLRKIVAESIKKTLMEAIDDDYLEDIMIYDLISKLGISENAKHELLSATLYNGNDEPVGKLNDLHVKYDARDGRNGGLVGSF